MNLPKQNPPQGT